MDGERGQEISATTLVQTWLRNSSAVTNAHPFLVVSNTLLVPEPPQQSIFPPVTQTGQTQISPKKLRDSLMICGEQARLGTTGRGCEEVIAQDGSVEEVMAIHMDQEAFSGWDIGAQLKLSQDVQCTHERLSTLLEWREPNTRTFVRPEMLGSGEALEDLFDLLWNKVVGQLSQTLIRTWFAPLDSSFSPADTRAPNPATPDGFGVILAVSRKHLLHRQSNRPGLNNPSPGRRLLKKNMSNYSSEVNSESATPIHMQGIPSRADSRSESPQFLLASFETSHLANNSVGFKTDRLKSTAGGTRTRSIHAERPSIVLQTVSKLPPISKYKPKKSSKTPERKPRTKNFRAGLHPPDSALTQSNFNRDMLFRRTRPDVSNYLHNGRYSPARFDSYHPPSLKSQSPQRVISLHFKSRRS